MSKVTADTITDEQIRELRGIVTADGDKAACARALNAGNLWATHEIAQARARCAEIWNARHAGVRDGR